MAYDEYPPPQQDEDLHTGLYPVDFILESILLAGLEWFRTTSGSGKKVYGHLGDPWLAKYGEAKILEIENFIKKYDIRVVQHFSLIDAQYPTISIQLMDGSEMTERAGLADHSGDMDVLDGDENVVGRSEIGYIPVLDNMQIGIHNTQTPDLTKYLYSFVIYVLSAFKPEMEKRGMQLGTFRATDLSRMNEYLPANMYSRFINFSIFTTASFDKGAVPIIERFMVEYPDVSVSGPDAIVSDNVDDIELQLRVKDTGDLNG